MMATKKAPVEKAEKIEEPVVVAEKYFAAVGRRKASVAQARLIASEKAGENDVVVNDMKMKLYFPTLVMQSTFLAPLKGVGLQNKFKVSIKVSGGGKKGQVEAARLAISRSLVKFDEGFKKTLRGLGFLTRDARVVERKKPGLKKARRSPQWAKR